MFQQKGSTLLFLLIQQTHSFLITLTVNIKEMPESCVHYFKTKTKMVPVEWSIWMVSFSGKNTNRKVHEKGR